MKIVHYSAQFDNQGGIERVVGELTRILGLHGVDTALIAEGGETADYVINSMDPQIRKQVWNKVVKCEMPDLVVFHFVAEHYLDFILDEIRLLRDVGVCCICVDHASCLGAMLIDGDELINQWFYRVAKECSVALTVSKLDAYWWRGLGIRAFHVQNPFVHPCVTEGVAKRDDSVHPIELLWIGRQSEQKQPDVAVDVFYHAVQIVPSMHLTMIGDSDAGWNGIRQTAKRLGISKKVSCLGQRRDLSDLWCKADIHLLTSVTESFCLVLAEAKAHGVPTVMFDIPFLELVESGKGLEVVPQGDVDGMARKIAALAQDDARRRKLGKEAQASLAAFNDEAVWKSWKIVFDALESGEGGTEILPEVKMIVGQVDFAWNRYCQKNLWAVQMARDVSKLTGGFVNFRGLARVLRLCVQGIQKIKAVLRG